MTSLQDKEFLKIWTNETKEGWHMLIPDNLTCGDCVHFSRCQWMFGCQKSSNHCDWYPIKFVKKEMEIEE